MCAVSGEPRRTDNQWKQRPAYFRVVLALTCVYFSFIYFIYISLIKSASFVQGHIPTQLSRAGPRSHSRVFLPQRREDDTVPLLSFSCWENNSATQLV